MPVLTVGRLKGGSGGKPNESLPSLPGLEFMDSVTGVLTLREREFRCQDGLMVEGTAMQRAWADGGESRRRSMELVKQRHEMQRQKAAERERRRLEKEMREILGSGDKFW
ncbi:hypothetical protein TWF192_002690 [Orbilia oligospora]|uniref:Uncharacterized protein n=1 Tax=Orbilia oligospora TaxID=2813651 RepID=A0A6G1MG00_ORBOL|nr:hypothetical protein TWF679_004004 [Orbilia oligospora]KAF3225510.1 hypothetical protein TWF191_005215 [Orbilia oligospora]KAF3255334.1 hypothetical protein TWF192_002690 [Orbilia oligospora]